MRIYDYSVPMAAVIEPSGFGGAGPDGCGMGTKILLAHVQIPDLTPSHGFNISSTPPSPPSSSPATGACCNHCFKRGTIEQIMDANGNGYIQVCASNYLKKNPNDDCKKSTVERYIKMIVVSTNTCSWFI